MVLDLILIYFELTLLQILQAINVVNDGGNYDTVHDSIRELNQNFQFKPNQSNASIKIEFLVWFGSVQCFWVQVHPN